MFFEPTDTSSAFVFSGLPVIRCDGDFADGIAWAGPVYYGHSPNGWSGGNVFNYQTKSVSAVYKALDEKQRKQAVIAKGNPGEQAKSVQFKPKAEDRPGLPIAELSKDQKAAVEVMLSSCRRTARKTSMR